MAIAATVLNIAGGLLLTSDPMMILGLLDRSKTSSCFHNFLCNSAREPGIVSWHRLAYLMTGQEINVSLVRIAAVHIAWIGLVAGRFMHGQDRRWCLPY